MSVYRKWNFEVGEEFTPWSVPEDCNFAVLKNNGPGVIVMRSDKNDAQTEDTLAVGAQEGIMAPISHRVSSITRVVVPITPRFAANECILWVKTNSGTQTLTSTYLTA